MHFFALNGHAQKNTKYRYKRRARQQIRSKITVLSAKERTPLNTGDRSSNYHLRSETATTSLGPFLRLPATGLGILSRSRGQLRTQRGKRQKG